MKIQYFCSETTLFESLATFCEHHKLLAASRACYASARPAQQKCEVKHPERLLQRGSLSRLGASLYLSSWVSLVAAPFVCEH